MGLSENYNPKPASTLRVFSLNFGALDDLSTRDLCSPKHDILP
jgi:hypothetical protein